MFDKLLSWFRERFARTAQPSADSYDVYDPKEKMVYRYWDGEGMRRADPMVLWRAMMEVGPELAIDIKVADSPLKDAPKAHQSACKKIRGVFSIKEFDQGGLSEVKLLELADHFMIYCHSVKKNSRVSVTVDLPDASWNTSPTSESGLTDEGHSIAKPELSPTVPP